MNFKAFMIIFVIEMGRMGDVTPSGVVSTTLYPTLAQCEFAKQKLEAALDKWHYGKENTESYEKYPVKRTVECHEFPATQIPELPSSYADQVDDLSELPPVLPTEEEHYHKRWND